MQMDLLYNNGGSPGQQEEMPAYERLLLEALGATAPTSSPPRSWRRAADLDPALRALGEQKVRPEPYAPGGRNPAAADDLAKKHGMSKFGSDRTARSKPSYVYASPAERKEAAGDALAKVVRQASGA